MPTYAYRCKSCGHEFEELQKISDDPVRICPKCKKETVIRIIGGGAGLVFKGSGFYLTDYKKTSTSSAGKSPSSETSSSKKEKPDSPKKDTPPASSSSPSES